MSIKVSVIIPVYNAEKYLAQCIESLIYQTLQDCEFIFINDGSVDKSREIISDYQKKDKRIKLINQENQGVSKARNTGLKVARGVYIGFVDADDFIERDMYETLYFSALKHKYDVVISNFESELDGHKIIISYPFPQNKHLCSSFISQEIIPYFIKEDNLNSIWNKIYKREILEEYNLRFPKGVTLGEDQLFNLKFFSYSNSAFYTNYSGYHYREVEGSATRNPIQKDYFKRTLEVYKLDLPSKMMGSISSEEIKKLKTIKFIKSVIANIHIYFNPSKEVSFKNRYQYVKQMIGNEYVQEALPFFYEKMYQTLGRYERQLIHMMKRKFIFGLYLATAYSRHQNK